MLYACLSLIGKALHLDEVDREIADFVPHMQNDIYLAQEVALRVALEVQTSIGVLADVQVIFFARWA